MCMNDDFFFIQYLILLIPALDYKKLTTADSPLQVLKPVLTSANVHLLAKLATKIPTKVCYCTFNWKPEEKVNSIIKLLKTRTETLFLLHHHSCPTF